MKKNMYRERQRWTDEGEEGETKANIDVKSSEKYPLKNL